MSRIRVAVNPGPFSSQRIVSFRGTDETHYMVIDAVDILDGDMIPVVEIMQRGDDVLIQLPHDTPHGMRVWVPRSLVEADHG